MCYLMYHFHKLTCVYINEPYIIIQGSRVDNNARTTKAFFNCPLRQVINSKKMEIEETFTSTTIITITPEYY